MITTNNTSSKTNETPIKAFTSLLDFRASIASTSVTNTTINKTITGLSSNRISTSDWSTSDVVIFYLILSMLMLDHI